MLPMPTLLQNLWTVVAANPLAMFAFGAFFGACVNSVLGELARRDLRRKAQALHVNSSDLFLNWSLIPGDIQSVVYQFKANVFNPSDDLAPIRDVRLLFTDARQNVLATFRLLDEDGMLVDQIAAFPHQHVPMELKTGAGVSNHSQASADGNMEALWRSLDATHAWLVGTLCENAKPLRVLVDSKLQPSLARVKAELKAERIVAPAA
jgi:hypothetical protein